MQACESKSLHVIDHRTDASLSINEFGRFVAEQCQVSPQVAQLVELPVDRLQLLVEQT